VITKGSDKENEGIYVMTIFDLDPIIHALLGKVLFKMLEENEKRGNKLTEDQVYYHLLRELHFDCHHPKCRDVDSKTILLENQFMVCNVDYECLICRTFIHARKYFVVSNGHYERISKEKFSNLYPKKQLRGI
jgi:hypothetical protein